MPEAQTETPVFDVRALIPAERHRQIFARVEALKPGEGFLLVNDHDPKPLYYQLNAEFPGRFGWEYVTSGPAQWQVLIARNAA